MNRFLRERCDRVVCSSVAAARWRRVGRALCRPVSMMASKERFGRALCLGGWGLAFESVCRGGIRAHLPPASCHGFPRAGSFQPLLSIYFIVLLESAVIARQLGSGARTGKRASRTARQTCTALIPKSNQAARSWRQGKHGRRCSWGGCIEGPNGTRRLRERSCELLVFAQKASGELQEGQIVWLLRQTRHRR
jgi:hypothetical protein